MISRYAIKEIEQLWSDENKFHNWTVIELANCEALVHTKTMPKSDYEALVNHLQYTIEDIYAMEQITKHDVIAFTRVLSRNFSGPQKKWIHYGLTSSDVVDTANGMAIQQTNMIILKELTDLIVVLTTMAQNHKNTLMIGRTHGMHAEVISFGFKLIGWVDELNRQLERFNLACKNVEVCKVSGAVGTFANIDPTIQTFIAKKLDLHEVNYATQIVQRDNHAFYFDVLKSIALSINKFATELRHLHRSEVNEVSEYFDAGQKGSSAMPHKKNPIGLENICGLSRMLSGYALVANENTNLWHERDISHSSAERIIFVDGTSSLVYILRRFIKIMQTLIINDQQMLKNLQLNDTKIFSGRVLSYLVEHSPLTREEIYDEIQKLIIQSEQTRQPFKSLLNQHRFKQYIDDLETLFDYHYYVRNLDIIYQKVLNRGK